MLYYNKRYDQYVLMTNAQVIHCQLFAKIKTIDVNVKILAPTLLYTVFSSS